MNSNRHKTERPRHVLMTQRDVAEILGTTRAVVEKAEKSAFAKLRRAITAEANLAGMDIRTWLYGA